MSEPTPRCLIAFDGEKWFVRRIASVLHDGVRDEIVYSCDEPISIGFIKLEDAAKVAKHWLKVNT